MTEISVKNAPDAGATIIEIRHGGLTERRLKLRDVSTGKYLTRRGWTKTASFLPVEADLDGDAATLSLGAELSAKIPPGARLCIEQPASDLKHEFAWRIAGDPALDESDTVGPPEPELTEALALDSFEPHIMDDRMEAETGNADTQEREIGVTRPAARSYEPALDEDDRRSWRPMAAAAAVCLFIGLGIGSLWAGTGDDTVRDVREAASIQIETQKREFEQQLAAARADTAAMQASVDANDKATASGKSQDADRIIRERDTALKQAANKAAEANDLENRLAVARAEIESLRAGNPDATNSQIDALRKDAAALKGKLDVALKQVSDRDKQLADAEKLSTDAARQAREAKVELAETKQQLGARDKDLAAARDEIAKVNLELASVRQSADDQAEVLDTKLSGRIESLKTELEQAKSRLAEREAALRDVQVDALKSVAAKSASADLETTALRKKLAAQSSELDTLTQSLAEKDSALAAANGRLTEFEAKLENAGPQNSPAAVDASSDEGASRVDATDVQLSRLREERDLFANELKALTNSFTALKDEKSELEKVVADLRRSQSQTDLTTSATPSMGFWGATAIDRAGAIYSLQNQTTEKAAQDNVTAMCRGKSQTDCEPLASYSNACFSLARIEGEAPANDNFAYFVHRDAKTSAETALERCRSMGTECTIRFTSCSPDGLTNTASN